VSKNSSWPQKRGASMEISSSVSVETRQQRKKALKVLVQILQIVLSAEKQYLDDMADCRFGSDKYDDADQAIRAIDEALEILENAYC